MPDWIADSHFINTVIRSLAVMFSVIAISIGVGLPLGTLAGLYQFRGRRLFLAIVAIPLLMPSFLWAIGLSQFQILMNISGFSDSTRALGSIYVFSSLVIPLSIYASMLSVKSLSSHQIDALAMIGSSQWCFFQIMKRAAPISVLISLLAGIVTLSDPGPGLILGFSGAATEILVSFSALFDFDLARRQCFLVAGLSLLFSLPIILLLGPNLSSVLLAQDSSSAKLSENAAVERFAIPAFIVLLLIILAIPMVGIFKPLMQEFDAAYAFKVLQRTGINTIFYSLTAGFLSTIFGLTVILCFGRYQKMKVVLITFSLLFIVLPSSFVALNVIEWGASVSEDWDWLLRGRFLVASVIGFRFFPIAILLIINRYAAISPSWSEAANVSGVSNIKFFLKVILPFIAPSLALSILIVSLLATAEIGTVLLLRPPGEDSFPLAIFTVMANASEVKVSSLCFIFFVIAICNLSILWALLARKT